MHQLHQLSDLKPDPQNARVHTARNQGAIERSIQRNGFGRSILLARDGTIIAGNATADAAGAAGLEDVRIVESDGRTVIAIKRMDIEPGSREFFELAIADNRAAELAEGWNLPVLAELAAQIDLNEFWRPDEWERLIADQVAAGMVANPEPESDQTEPRTVTCPQCGHCF